NRVAGCFIGTSANGLTASPNAAGVLTDYGNSIGGSAVADRNLISGNNGSGVASSRKFNTIVGNYIGTDATGTVAIPTNPGISISEFGVWPTSNSISFNLVSGNWSHGLWLRGGGGGSLNGNLIGTDATGTVPLGNGGNGISIILPHPDFGSERPTNNVVAYNGAVG